MLCPLSHTSQGCRAFFSSHRITHSPGSSLALASSPDSTFDWFRYFQRKYDFHFSAQFRNKNVNFRLTLVNTQSGDASQASLSSGTQESRVSGTEHQTCSCTGCQPCPTGQWEHLASTWSPGRLRQASGEEDAALFKPDPGCPRTHFQDALY